MTMFTQDNREVTSDSVFIALPGLECDGHSFIQDALKRGAKKIVFHDESYKLSIPRKKQMCVLDTEEWLIQKTQEKIKKAKVITICGSVGKTTTTSLTYELLKNRSGKSVFTPRFGINTLRGICLEILNKYKGQQIILLETGMDFYLELDKIADVFNPEINAVVSIDISHFEKLKSMDRILRTEFGVCTSSKLKYLVTSHNIYIDKFLESEYKNLIKGKVFTKSKLILAQNTENRIQPSHFTNNLNVAVAILKLIKPNAKKIQEIVDKWQPVDKRFEILKVNEKEILNDTYNAAPSSFQAFLEYSKNAKRKKLGIIGQINEIGTLTERYHTQIYKNANKVFDMCIFVGENFKAPKRKNVVNDYSQAIEAVKKLKLKDYAFFGVKGSRGVKLENVTDFLKKSL